MQTISSSYDRHDNEAPADRPAGPGRAGPSSTRPRGVTAGAHVPEKLDDDPERRDEIARLVELAIDAFLVAVVTQDRLHPKHLRELDRPRRALDG